jgi:predicted amidophosphoribosyltransferase
LSLRYDKSPSHLGKTNAAGAGVASETVVTRERKSQAANQSWWQASSPPRPSALSADLHFCGNECESRLGSPLFCPPCDAALAISRRACCPRCARACSDSDVAQGNCGDCRGRKLLFQAARTIAPYDGALRQAVLKGKHAHFEPLAIALGQRLAAMLAERPFDACLDYVVPVPRHWLKRIWRGTHPAATIARSLAAHLGLPLARNVLICRRLLRTQALLSPAQRLQNVRGAFRASRWRDISGKTILIVDDVMTTGATAQEASRALLAASAAAVYVATVARSDPHF